ncbi:diacylglycerol kinase family lipid kinase [Mucilaginibacter conchicola]|uniref:Diacylglycerol kinase family lipid kinase n=1 Tax=Mucilaginibacter conchicola TaxID=2303333 RepID=A0A372NQP2_9SPHI|nr:diacylglycerol kinase family protein [Mucilaginibacter conchicola]RFZ91269.1 diacylglycerol kinase family lipid kinase [Mucilaginibacter conchicola]
MKIKHIHFIVNPASGKQEPVLAYINAEMTARKVDWDVSVTKKNVRVADLARKLFGKTDLIAVYGGDGCVTEVAAALQGGNVPMAIIPGGTANVMARELGIPLDTQEALASLFDGSIKKIDMGLVNDIPFLLRVNLGIMADMVTQADRKLKDKVGQLAYGITALKTTALAKPVDYELKIDGKRIETGGVSLTVTNSGHLGVGDFALQPGISITDGRLDVILLKENNLPSLLKVAGSTLLKQKSEVLEHWRGKKITITTAKKQSFICDDRQEKARILRIEVLPGTLKMLVPKKKK